MSKLNYTHEVFKEIESKWHDKTFMASYFMDLAEKYGKKYKSNTDALTAIEVRGVITKVGSVKRPGGGAPLSVYELIPGSVYEIKNGADYKRINHQKEVYRKNCSLKIQRFTLGL